MALIDESPAGQPAAIPAFGVQYAFVAFALEGTRFDRPGLQEVRERWGDRWIAPVGVQLWFAFQTLASGGGGDH